MSVRTISFRFGNRRISAAEGDSIAKALFDAGVRTLSYSVKYKRPRGLHCARGRCIMCHMEVDGVPGVPTCITPVEDGMHVRRENHRPFFAPLLVAAARMVPLPAGFYYRMFTRPTVVRRLFLGTLRRMAGVGRVNTTTPSRPAAAVPGTSIKSAYNVVVVGAGLSGMAAAVAAARRGASVLLVDEYGEPGGHSIGFHRDEARAAARADLAAAAASSATIDRLMRTTAQGFYPPDALLLGHGGSVAPPDVPAGMRRVRASSFIFATGGYDVIPLFENNDTPGIFGARSMRLLLERDKLRPGTHAVVYGCGEELVDAVQLLLHHGIRIAAVVNAGEPSPGAFGDAPCYDRSRVTAARGGRWLRSVRVAGARTPIECDMLCTAFNTQGAYELAYQAGFRFEMSKDAYYENKVMQPTEIHRQSDGISFHLAGELAGQRTWGDIITSGEAAGDQASHFPGSRQTS